MGIDKLTGLPDREGGYALARQGIVEAQQKQWSLVALWIDIDRFHTVNHSFGHLGGDRFVYHVAKRIQNSIRIGDTLARISGDEFILILPNTLLPEASAVVKDIERALKDPVAIDGVLVHPTVSIGIAALEADEDESKLLLRADRAKAEAKSNGGNGFSVSGEKLTYHGYRLAREELEIEAKLRRAMESSSLLLHYQPIVRADGSVEAVEALMRCRVDGEQIPPTKLIPVAEKTGLVGRLGEWTMCEGAAFSRHLLDGGFPIKVAVNVSRAQLLAPRFLEALHGALLLSNLPPHLLELELTESLFLDDSATVQKNLLGAREAGVGLAIDDFGTGYSSLAILKDVPATKLKLDRSFVIVLPHDRKALAVVRAMTSLAHELGLVVVAEGVELDEQRVCLEQLDVDSIQGYLHSRPIPQHELTQWLRTRPSPKQACFRYE